MKKYVKLFEEFVNESSNIGTNKEVKDNEAFKTLVDNSDKLKQNKLDARIEKAKEDGIGLLAEGKTTKDVDTSKFEKELKEVIKKYKSKIDAEQIHDILNVLVNIQKNKF